METLAEIRPDHADLCRIIALTGARLAEMRDLAWSEVDFSRPAVVLAPARHKTGQPRQIRFEAPTSFDGLGARP